MLIIPVINCLDKDCVRERLKVIESFGSDWVKFDISDGRFNPVTTWNAPETIKTDMKIEVHLMVEDVVTHLKNWLKVGAVRPIVHIESSGFDIKAISSLCDEHDAELMLAIKPSTSLENIFPYLNGEKASVKYVQLLAVDPGESGQRFQEHTLEKIKELKQNFPNVIIEIDGGVNDEVAKAVKNAGADIVVASSYIFNSDNPKKTFNELKQAVNV